MTMVTELLRLVHEVIRPSEEHALALEIAFDLGSSAGAALVTARNEQDELDRYAAQWDRDAYGAGNQLAGVSGAYRGYLWRRDHAAQLGEALHPLLSFPDFVLLNVLAKHPDAEGRQRTADMLPHLRAHILDVEASLCLEPEAAPFLDEQEYDDGQAEEDFERRYAGEHPEEDYYGRPRDMYPEG